MELSTERQDGVLLANVSGRIDPKSAGALETAIAGALQNGDHAVILDFEQLVYIGNTGIRALRMGIIYESPNFLLTPSPTRLTVESQLGR